MICKMGLDCVFTIASCVTVSLSFMENKLAFFCKLTIRKSRILHILTREKNLVRHRMDELV